MVLHAQWYKFSLQKSMCILNDHKRDKANQQKHHESEHASCSPPRKAQHRPDADDGVCFWSGKRAHRQLAAVGGPLRKAHKISWSPKGRGDLDITKPYAWLVSLGYEWYSSTTVQRIITSTGWIYVWAKEVLNSPRHVLGYILQKKTPHSECWNDKIRPVHVCIGKPCWNIFFSK
jgi:hypothetical protein